jgi:hypothetical protein
MPWPLASFMFQPVLRRPFYGVLLPAPVLIISVWCFQWTEAISNQGEYFEPSGRSLHDLYILWIGMCCIVLYSVLWWRFCIINNSLWFIVRKQIEENSCCTRGLYFSSNNALYWTRTRTTFVEPMILFFIK